MLCRRVLAAALIQQNSSQALERWQLGERQRLLKHITSATQVIHINVLYAAFSQPRHTSRCTQCEIELRQFDRSPVQQSVHLCGNGIDQSNCRYEIKTKKKKNVHDNIEMKQETRARERTKRNLNANVHLASKSDLSSSCSARTSCVGGHRGASSVRGWGRSDWM